MNIIVTGDNAIPMYEQIAEQIKAAILQGELEQGSALPSIRILAKELKVSIITVKKAYEALEQEGFIQTVIGKGCYVSMENRERLIEMRISQLESRLEEIILSAKGMNISLEELQNRVQIIYEEVE